MKVKQPRKVRGYKITDAAYNKALKKGKGELATLIEQWVTAFGQGFNITMEKKVLIELPNGYKSYDTKNFKAAEEKLKNQSTKK